MSPALLANIALALGTVGASAIAAFVTLRVAAKGAPTPADQLATMMAAGAKNFQAIIAEYQEQNVHLAERLAQVEARVAALENERHTLRNQVTALQKRNALHDEDRASRGLPPLPYPPGTDIEALMGSSYVAQYTLDNRRKNRGPIDDQPLGSDAADIASLKGKIP